MCVCAFLTACVLLTEAMQIRHVSAPDWNRSLTYWPVLARPATSPPGRRDGSEAYFSHSWPKTSSGGSDANLSCSRFKSPAETHQSGQSRCWRLMPRSFPSSLCYGYPLLRSLHHYRHHQTKRRSSCVSLPVVVLQPGLTSWSPQTWTGPTHLSARHTLTVSGMSLSPLLHAIQKFCPHHLEALAASVQPSPSVQASPSLSAADVIAHLEHSDPGHAPCPSVARRAPWRHSLPGDYRWSDNPRINQVSIRLYKVLTY